jgi:hypothetical protein
MEGRGRERKERRRKEMSLQRPSRCETKVFGTDSRVPYTGK